MYRFVVRTTLIIFLPVIITGCASLGYYSHVMNGHFELMSGEQPIDALISEGKISKELQKKLQQVLQIRQFAVTELGLPDNDSYKTFVKLNRQYPVWNVVAAEQFSVKPRQWCFLIVGCISYRGYFNEQDARVKANELKAEGYDVYVAGAAAYSTLGWFDDPVLSSMLYKEESHLAGIIFHELAHQQVYIDDDSAFNEAFATAVELEGVRRWLKVQGDPQAINKYRTYKTRQAGFNKLLRKTQTQLAMLYKQKYDKQTMLQKKQQIIKGMKTDYQQLKKQWQGYKGYDDWMSKEINNARLALVATYHELVPAFERILKEQDYALDNFYREVKALGEMDKDKRHELLTSTVNARRSAQH